MTEPLTKPAHEPTLVRAHLNPEAKKVEVVVDDPGGHRRQIDYSWKSREPIALPDIWWGAVVKETSFQRSAETKGSAAFFNRY